MGVVLGGASDHGGAADIDVLDCLFKRAARARDGLRKRIQVDDNQIDRLNTRLPDRLDMGGQIAPRQNAAVYRRVQRLHATIEHFRKAGVIRHFGRRNATVVQQLRGAAGGQHLDATAGERTRKFNHAGLVGYA